MAQRDDRFSIKNMNNILLWFQETTKRLGIKDVDSLSKIKLTLKDFVSDHLSVQTIGATRNSYKDLERTFFEGHWGYDPSYVMPEQYQSAISRYLADKNEYETIKQDIDYLEKILKLGSGSESPAGSIQIESNEIRDFKKVNEQGLRTREQN